MPGATLWLTGLPCSGKTTIARSVESALRDRNVRVEVLDGEEIRARLSPDLGFSRVETAREIGLYRRLRDVRQVRQRDQRLAIPGAHERFAPGREENAQTRVRIPTHPSHEALQRRAIGRELRT